MNSDLAIFLVFIVIVIFLILYMLRKKKFNGANVQEFNSNVGGGKTSTAIYVGMTRHKFCVTSVKFSNFWRKVFKLEQKELPYCYCNIPIYKNRKKGILWKWYKPFTMEHLLRKVRVEPKSTTIITEASLIATSMDGVPNKNGFTRQQNDTLNLFLKLYRHYSLGGTCIVETQSRDDLHYSFDRNISVCTYIFRAVNLPFFRFVKCRDLFYANNVQNTFDEDVTQDKSLKWFLIPKSIFNKYDSYYYNRLSKDLPLIENNHNCYIIPTLHDYEEIRIYNEKVLKGEIIYE